MDEIKPVECNEHLCFKCLQNKEHINKYELSYRGYGSSFDNVNTKLQLCDECNDSRLEEWFGENPEIDDYFEEYKYEDNIFDFVNELPIQGRELFYNSCSNDSCLESQDWIDIELEIAPDNTYKKYGMYSPSEKKAYKDRFPTCENVYRKVYSDGSSHCKCDFGAYGEIDGSAENYNIYKECYYCKRYKKKESAMRVEYEPIIKKDNIKNIMMQEWTCPKCGNINHSHIYNDKYKSHYSCEKCSEYFTLVE